MAINTWSAGNGYQTVHEHAPRLSPPLPPPPPANAILMSGSPAAPPVACVALPRHYPQQQQQVYPYVRNPPPSMWSPPPHSMATTPTPPPPSPPFAGVTSAGEPFTVYHVCRICHRPRSQRYHREQSVYPDGSALALDICHRCRDVVEVDEVGEERTAMRKKSEARISIHTKPRSDNEGRGQSRASNSRTRPKRSKSRITVLVEQDGPSTNSHRTISPPAALESISREGDKPIHRYLKGGKSKRAEPEKHEPDNARSNKGEGSHAPSAEQDTRSLITQPATYPEASSSVRSISPGIAMAVRQAELCNLQLSSPIEPALARPPPTPSEVRAIAREEVEGYRKAERLVEQHPRPFAHGTLVPVDAPSSRPPPLPHPHSSHSSRVAASNRSHAATKSSVPPAPASAAHYRANDANSTSGRSPPDPAETSAAPPAVHSPPPPSAPSRAAAPSVRSHHATSRSAVVTEARTPSSAYDCQAMPSTHAHDDAVLSVHSRATRAAADRPEPPVFMHNHRADDIVLREQGWSKPASPVKAEKQSTGHDWEEVIERRREQSPGGTIRGLTIIRERSVSPTRSRRCDVANMASTVEPGSSISQRPPKGTTERYVVRERPPSPVMRAQVSRKRSISPEVMSNHFQQATGVKTQERGCYITRDRIATRERLPSPRRQTYIFGRKSSSPPHPPSLPQPPPNLTPQQEHLLPPQQRVFYREITERQGIMTPTRAEQRRQERCVSYSTRRLSPPRVATVVSDSQHSSARDQPYAASRAHAYERRASGPVPSSVMRAASIDTSQVTCTREAGEEEWDRRTYSRKSRLASHRGDSQDGYRASLAYGDQPSGIRSYASTTRDRREDEGAGEDRFSEQHPLGRDDEPRSRSSRMGLPPPPPAVSQDIPSPPASVSNRSKNPSTTEDHFKILALRRQDNEQQGAGTLNLQATAQQLSPDAVQPNLFHYHMPHNALNNGGHGAPRFSNHDRDVTLGSHPRSPYPSADYLVRERHTARGESISLGRERVIEEHLITRKELSSEEVAEAMRAARVPSSSATQHPQAQETRGRLPDRDHGHVPNQPRIRSILRGTSTSPQGRQQSPARLRAPLRYDCAGTEAGGLHVSFASQDDVLSLSPPPSETVSNVTEGVSRLRRRLRGGDIDRANGQDETKPYYHERPKDRHHHHEDKEETDVDEKYRTKRLARALSESPSRERLRLAAARQAEGVQTQAHGPYRPDQPPTESMEVLPQSTTSQRGRQRAATDVYDYVEHRRDDALDGAERFVDVREVRDKEGRWIEVKETVVLP